MSLLDALDCVAELLDLVDLITGRVAGTSGQQCVPTPRRSWWPPERTLVLRAPDRTTDRT
jgi:hypothetical protein